MDLNIILVILFLFSLLLTYISLKTKKSAIQIVDEMGFGWNLANSFECCDVNSNRKIDNPDDQITLWGNEIPTKEILLKLKRYGFKTIRFPVTWMYFMDESGKVDKKWMSSVRQFVDWVINYKMYCILNVHNDGAPNNWLTKGESAKEKFIILWQQIANEFKAYDEHLIFEAMNDIEYNGEYNYTLLFLFNQAFIDVIRNSEGYNKERLLILSGANKNIDLTCSEDYKIPYDPSNTIAISIHYSIPVYFTVERDDDPWYYFDGEGVKIIIEPMTKWGEDSHYKEMFSYFEIMKETFVDKGIPVIINYYLKSNSETIKNTALSRSLYITIGRKKVIRISFNVNILTNILWSVGFGVISIDKKGYEIQIQFSGTEGKREYDGSYTFTIDVTNIEICNSIEVQKWWGYDEAIINYLTVEFNQNYTIFNFDEYKSAL
jgi:endoglucanase